jgi:excisionase family DNA binding protein
VRRITDLEAFEHSYLTVQAFAAHLTVHERTVMKWIKAGRIPAHRFHGLWRIAKADALAFVEQSRFRV